MSLRGADGQPNENAVKRDIKAYLDSLGAYWFMTGPVAYGKRSIDFLCCVKGRFVGIEAKKPGEVATPKQRETMKQINLAGGLAFAADSVERVKKMIEDHILGAYDYARDS